MQSWKTLDRTTILDHSKYLRVEDHRVELPDGQVIPDWPWIITPDFVNVALITPGGQYVVFRQVKYAVEGASYAPVGGYLEPGEDPLVCAQREVLEETGYQSRDWVYLGSYVMDANRGVATAHLYLAKNAIRVSEPDADDLEEQEILLLDKVEVAAALTAGAFKVLSWAMVMLLALQHA